jgi:uncharacterized protein (DUF488 family)
MENGETPQSNLRILTIGHSDHAMEHFLSLLKTYSVSVVVDTRSYPYSNFAPQYDQGPLREALQNAGYQYLYLGRELGGRPEGEEYYDSEGHVLYGKVAETDFFRTGITRVEEGIRRYSVALLCSEENPAECHRRLLIGRVLQGDGVAIEHIRGDGRLQAESDLAQELDKKDPQMDLFGEKEAPEWKSVPSVLRKRRQSSSSAF